MSSSPDQPQIHLNTHPISSTEIMKCLKHPSSDNILSRSI
uniref:Uncharacterized protein n=1 Tax=Vitis vinifera TaxID=29760 RepID=F6H1Q3_VITVI